jgi:RNA polymerase sigma-70 factor (ECF subfamily)
LKDLQTGIVQETELLKKIAAGDVQAFKLLFESYQQSVFNLCYRFAKNRAEADDLCQEVFLKIYLAAQKFKHEAKVSTWIYRITVNHCLNYKRRSRLFDIFSLEQTDEKKISADWRLLLEENQPDTYVERKERERIVQAAINSLPQNQRVALILQRYENMSLQQIAEVLNSSVSSVQSRLARAKENLCQRLLPYLKNF